MSSSLALARKVLETEARAVQAVGHRLGATFNTAVRLLAACRGRIVVTGMGKSGHIGRKIAATLSATGTPAFYLHPAEGMHGDIGMMAKGDLVVAISYSGETSELADLLPAIRRMRLPVIALTGNPRSRLARASRVALDIHVREEACPFGLAPTASTTAALALGDALAICVLKRKGLKEADFARLHPGGAMGKKLLWSVADVMRTGPDNPVIGQTARVRDALLVMTRSRLGAVSVVDRGGRIAGFFTDGDLRRGLQHDARLLERRLTGVMTRRPTTVRPGDTVATVLGILKTRGIDNLPVVDGGRRPVGIVDERDLLAEGLI